MNNTSNFDLFYDVIDESIGKLYEIKHKPFMNLLIETAKNIVSSDVLSKEATKEQKDELMNIYAKLEDVEFNVEEIRKVFQIMILRAFKEDNLKFGDLTPDTLGFFIAYLISKLHPNKEKLTILDPVCGPGNLLYSVANHLNKEVKLFGIEIVREYAELASILGDLLYYDIEIFCQDTLIHPFNAIDVVVADINANGNIKEEKYFPYLVIIEHLSSLKKDGYFIGILPNDFFEHDSDGFFKEKLKESSSSVLGVLSLPSNMFKENPKSIVIFSKKEVSGNKCLLVDLPSFSDPGKLNQALLQIENWFLINLKEEEV